MSTGPRYFRKELCDLLFYASFLVLSPAQILFAEGSDQGLAYTYGLYGTPGLVDMPTAQSAADAEIAATIGYFAGTTRSTLSFQINPRLSGSFRYSRIENWLIATGKNTYDRSFDLRYRVLDEGAMRPAIAIGLQDMIGTGIYSGEYIVATKQVTPSVALTGGIGWGRLGTYQGFRNPLGFLGDEFVSRPSGFTGTGGQVEGARWFRGDAALFGGVSWQATDRLNLKAEYSSDAYIGETAPGRDLFTRNLPLNFGLSYAVTDSATLQAYSLYGSEIGAAVTVTTNPRKPLINGGVGQRPTPVVPRAPGAARDLGWISQADAPDILRDSAQRVLAAEGMTLEAMTTQATGVTVVIRNTTYLATAEAVGRTARILSRVMPASVEVFTIIPVVGGVRTAAIRIKRSDLEQLEFEPDNARISYARAEIEDAAAIGAGLPIVDGLYPRFQWRLGPYLSTSYFDPENPVRADVGLELSASYNVAPGVVFSGDLRKRIGGNVADGPASSSAIQPVRTDAGSYAAQGDPAITRLTGAYQFNLAPAFFGRVTGGYLESMYGGLSTEVLWKPVESRLGIGLELNYVKQRDFDQLFGFQDYDIVTGHVSGYYAFENNLHGQIDVGRYLAGDYGATFTLDREFANGWRVGAFATFTDVSFDDFGEGSFDKGLRFYVPLGHFAGTPTTRVYNTTLRPLLRDGGARLNVEGRLYETVRKYDQDALSDNWGRFWR